MPHVELPMMVQPHPTAAPSTHTTLQTPPIQLQQATTLMSALTTPPDNTTSTTSTSGGSDMPVLHPQLLQAADSTRQLFEQHNSDMTDVTWYATGTQPNQTLHTTTNCRQLDHATTHTPVSSPPPDADFCLHCPTPTDPDTAHAAAVGHTQTYVQQLQPQPDPRTATRQQARITDIIQPVGNPDVALHDLQLFLHQLRATTRLRQLAADGTYPQTRRQHATALAHATLRPLEQFRQTIGFDTELLLPQICRRTLLNPHGQHEQPAARRQQQLTDAQQLAHHGISQPDSVRSAACRGLNQITGLPAWNTNPVQAALEELQDLPAYLLPSNHELTSHDLHILETWYLPTLVNRVQQHLARRQTELLEPHIIVIEQLTAHLDRRLWPLAAMAPTHRTTQTTVYMQVPAIFAELTVGQPQDGTNLPLVLDLGPTRHLFTTQLNDSQLQDVLDTTTRQANNTTFRWGLYEAASLLQACAAALT